MIKIKISEIENIKVDESIINNCFNITYDKKLLHLLHQYLSKTKNITEIEIDRVVIFIYSRTGIISMYDFDYLYSDDFYFYIADDDAERLVINRILKMQKIYEKN